MNRSNKLVPWAHYTAKSTARGEHDSQTVMIYLWWYPTTKNRQHSGDTAVTDMHRSLPFTFPKNLANMGEWTLGFLRWDSRQFFFRSSNCRLWMIFREPGIPPKQGTVFVGSQVTVFNHGPIAEFQWFLMRVTCKVDGTSSIRLGLS